MKSWCFLAIERSPSTSNEQAARCLFEDDLGRAAGRALVSLATSARNLSFRRDESGIRKPFSRSKIDSSFSLFDYRVDIYLAFYVFLSLCVWCFTYSPLS